MFNTFAIIDGMWLYEKLLDTQQFDDSVQLRDKRHAGEGGRPGTEVRHYLGATVPIAGMFKLFRTMLVYYWGNDLFIQTLRTHGLCERGPLYIEMSSNSVVLLLLLRCWYMPIGIYFHYEKLQLEQGGLC